jgi:outer membrane lipopolysaccharide assembly protein LptE/RlpB
MTKKYTKICLTLISFLLLTGCGFKLRTARSLPPQLHQIYYQTDNPYGRFELALKRSLKASNVVLLAKSDSTAPILNVTAKYSYSTTSSISSSEAQVYTLNYNATISIDDTSNKSLLRPQTVTSSRAITLQRNEIFEITPQVEIAKREMRQELSTKILNILCAKKTFQALSEPPATKQTQ